MQCQYLSIGVNDNAENIVQQIDKELQQLKEKRINYSVKEMDFEGTTSVLCNIEEDGSAAKNLNKYELLKYHVSNALAEYVIQEYEDKLLIRLINSNYGYFNASEKKDILRISQKNIRNEDKIFFNTLFQIRRRNMIVRKFMEYFEGSSSIILDGFINFRLKDYIKELEDVIDNAVDDFLIEREYKEFIRLLKYFVEIQDSKFNIVHVVMQKDEQYILLDEKRHEITNECMQDFLYELPETEINHDDLLVSSLITLAPKSIVIHNLERFKNQKLLDTIKNIFVGKVILCGGCNICEYNLVKSDTKE
ncbi:putative sporulation protein YtxC [Ruminiclostridium sufflavum DSM 19573]|uniref:Putative sporulation protein YtxC n=1 Tax=Ruminiclostridium sufflavum DSM 19573 TaxID=1121337 RepID=A0A318XPW3_9FIRM|nr:putative sporulation protein YtxC [Ruminiclostridium sufflavum]PYG89220.1 putative sporulation protein YtxC [Ruminiclostridium sufflavum DSM 19573]